MAAERFRVTALSIDAKIDAGASVLDIGVIRPVQRSLGEDNTIAPLHVRVPNRKIIRNVRLKVLELRTSVVANADTLGKALGYELQPGRVFVAVDKGYRYGIF
jgi:hypothetical protein